MLIQMQDKLDPAHKNFDLFENPFSQEIWKARYAAEGETNIFQTFERVSIAIASKETNPVYWSSRFYSVQALGLFIPAGRILASAGLDTNSTLQNCYVSGTIEDSTEGIMQAYGEAMITLGRFGGIGMDFTPIRPKRAKVGSQGLISPGVVHWMDMWHQGADKIKQAGHRRGAMMGTLADHHPDILDFIEAKHTRGALTNFNVSILISDAFMDAVKNDTHWDLWHTAPKDAEQLKMMGTSHGRYVYSHIKARELWDKIMRSTYEYAEPGVIFIDKINKENNLWYCEDLRCTNPCGEQPLPPYGACNLGHINLARMVKQPFQNEAHVNMSLLKETVHIAVRFLDNVIDVSNFPLDAQKEEQINKRRVGLGVSGLADMLIQLNMRYDNPRARELVDEIMRMIAVNAYEMSAVTAGEKGSFPLFERTKYGAKGFARRMNTKSDMRNSLLLTVAPTGTTSIVFGNISSGIEPNFAFRMNRKVWVENNKHEEHVNESFISRFFKHCTDKDISECKVAIKAMNIDPLDHVAMQGVVQNWIDASVTKTVNCPGSMDFRDFQDIYTQAYEKGCKGCTTYRHSDLRGSVLEDADEIPELTDKQFETIKEAVADLQDSPRIIVDSVKEGLTSQGKPFVEVKFADVDYAKVEQRAIVHHLKRPEVLQGYTYRIKWPHQGDNIYLTVNERDGKPYEVFIASMDLRNIEWMVLNCIMLSQSLRHGENPVELAKLYQKIQGASEGAWIEKKYYTSLPAYIGKVLEDHFTRPTSEETNALRWNISTPDAESFLKYQSGGTVTGRTYGRGHIQEVPVGQKMSDFGKGAGSELPGGEESVGQAYIEGKRCISCGAPSLIKSEGCEKCMNCGYTKCG